MIKSLIIGIGCLIIFTSFTYTVAQEEVSILLGKNVTEWHAISAALISENRHEEAIKYYDKILEISPDDQKALLNKGSVLKDLDRHEEAIKYYDKILEISPNHVKALTSKGISLAFLHEWDEAEKLIVQAMELEPENKVIKSTMAQFLAGVPSIPAHGSIYDIKLLVTHRDSDDNLIAVSESSNTRYLPYSLTEKIFEKHLIEKNVVINGKTYDIAQKIDSFSPADDAMSLFSIFKTQYGHEIDVFLAFTPMLLTEKDDKLTVKWIIMKETT